MVNQILHRSIQRRNPCATGQRCSAQHIFLSAVISTPTDQIVKGFMEMRQLTGRAPCHRCKPLCAGLITGVRERTIRTVKAPLRQLCGPNWGQSWRTIFHSRVGKAGCVQVLDTILQALTVSAIPTTSGVNRGGEGKAGESPGAFPRRDGHTAPQCGAVSGDEG